MDATQKFNKVLFIDLDGTLIQPLGNREFPKGCWDMELSCLNEYCNVNATYSYCPTCNNNDNDRKPNPGMINRYIESYNIKKEDCLMVGDREEDMFCAKNAGIKFVDVEEFTKEFTNIF